MSKASIILGLSSLMLRKFTRTGLRLMAVTLLKWPRDVLGRSVSERE